MRKWSLGIVTACIIILALGQIFQKRKILWNDYFLTESKQPYGLYILQEQLQERLAGKIFINKNEIGIWADTIKRKKQNIVFIEPDIDMDSIAIKRLKALVYKGNNVFFASEYFNNHWMEFIGARCSYFYSDWNNTMDKNGIKAWINGKENELYAFDKGTIRNVFHISEDSLVLKEFTKNKGQQNLDTLGFVATGKSNFVRMAYGKGYFYFHSNPHCFTNYFLSNTKTYNYAFEALSLMPKAEIWVIDEYYKKYKTNFSSPLRYILKEPSLKWAYYLAIILLFLYAIISAKRLQREIPVIELPKNATMQFVKTIGDLYFEKGNNKDIVEKRLRYFQEYLRQKLNIHENDLSKQMDILQKKTAHEKAFLAELYQNMKVAKSKSLNNDELIHLFQLLDEFYRKT